jgi:hypothetical protein
VTPDSSQFDGGNKRLSDSKEFGYFPLRMNPAFEQRPNPPYVFDGQFVPGVIFSLGADGSSETVSFCMVPVLFWSNPFQIFRPIILFVPVFVVDLLLRKRRGKKSLRD